MQVSVWVTVELNIFNLISPGLFGPGTSETVKSIIGKLETVLGRTRWNLLRYQTPRTVMVNCNCKPVTCVRQ